jgi:PAS domain S-box-containing protein
LPGIGPLKKGSTVFNESAERSFGYAAAEVLGTSVFDLLEPTVVSEQHAAIRDVQERLGRGERVAPQEIVRRRKDGSLYDSLVTRFAIRDSSGAVVAIANTLQDISERKRYERQQAVLAAVSTALAASIDYDQTLTTVARLSPRASSRRTAAGSGSRAKRERAVRSSSRCRNRRERSGWTSRLGLSVCQSAGGVPVPVGVQLLRLLPDFAPIPR